MPQGHQNRPQYRGHPSEGTQIKIVKESSKTEGQKATPIKTTNQKPHHIAERCDFFALCHIVIKNYLGYIQNQQNPYSHKNLPWLNAKKNQKNHKINKKIKKTENKKKKNTKPQKHSTPIKPRIKSHTI